MSATLSPPMFLQFQNPNNSGSPAVGFKLFTYQAGTSVKQATWTDSTQLVQNANPLPLDANGVAAGGASAAVWGDPSLTYKFVWAPANDTDPPSSPIRTIDNITFPISLGFLQVLTSQPILASYARTAAEIAAGVTPTNYTYSPGHILRYGTNTIPGTTDMTTAFSNALASNNAVYAPTGTYLVSSQLTLQSNQTLYGDGSATVINFSSTANTDFIVGSTVSNTTVRDLKLVATGVTTVMNYQGMVAFRGATACKVLRCEIQGFYASGIVLNACQFCEVDKNYLHGSQGALGSNSDIHVLSTASASSIANIISNNICSGGTNDFGIGIFQVLTTGLPLIKNLVTGNRITQHAAYGILVYDSATVGSNTWNEISNNYVENIQGSSGVGQYGAGIYVAENGGVVISNNIIRNCCVQTSVATLTPAGIGVNQVAGFAPFSITGNAIFDMAQGNVSGVRISGIHVTNGSTGGVISGNLITQQTNGGLTVGIFAPAPGANLTISGNEVNILNTLASTTGIFCYANGAALSGLTVNGNLIQGCSSAYIEIFNNGAFNITNVSVNGNTCSGGAAGCIGLLMQNWIQGSVTGNVINTGTGISLNLSSCTQTRVTGNTFITTGTQAVVTGGTCTASYYDKSNYANTGIVNAATGMICEQLASATPGASFNSAVGDRIEQSIPVVGNPKGWRCTVAGGPGTWVSEGAL